MMLRKVLLSALTLGVMAAAPAFAADTTPAAPAGDHAKMEHKNPADTDGDGFISKAEFDAMQNARFTKLDTNKDGKLSKEEMKTGRESMRERMTEMKNNWKAKHDDKTAAPAAGQ